MASSPDIASSSNPSPRKKVCLPCSWFQSHDCDGQGCIFNECFPSENDKTDLFLLRDTLGPELLKDRLQEMKDLGIAIHHEGTAIHWAKEKAIEFKLIANISMSSRSAVGGRINHIHQEMSTGFEKINRDVEVITETQLSNYAQHLECSVLHKREIFKINRDIHELQQISLEGIHNIFQVSDRINQLDFNANQLIEHFQNIHGVVHNEVHQLLANVNGNIEQLQINIAALAAAVDMERVIYNEGLIHNANAHIAQLQINLAVVAGHMENLLHRVNNHEELLGHANNSIAQLQNNVGVLAANMEDHEGRIMVLEFFAGGGGNGGMAGGFGDANGGGLGDADAGAFGGMDADVDGGVVLDEQH